MTYASVAELRALDGMGESDVTDPMLEDALDFAEEVIDMYCGTSFTFKTFTVVVSGNGHSDLDIGVLFPQTLTTVTIDGVVTVSTGWGLYPEGVLVRSDGTFPTSTVGRNITVVGTAGASAAAPQRIKKASLLIARQHILDDVSRVTDRALSMTNEFGNISLAQPGGLWRPTSLPEVNTILNRYRHRAPGAY